MECPPDPIFRSVRLSPLHKVSRTQPSAFRPQMQNGLMSVLSYQLLSRQLKTFDDISSVLTLSSPSRLNLSEIYDVAKESLSSFFPHKPTPYYEFGQLEEALVLAIEHDVKPVRDEPIIFDATLSLWCGS